MAMTYDAFLDQMKKKFLFLPVTAKCPELMHSLTALLAITGDWGRPQRRDFSDYSAVPAHPARSSAHLDHT